MDKGAAAKKGAKDPKKKEKEKEEKPEEHEEVAPVEQEPTDRGTGVYIFPDGSRYEGDWQLFPAVEVEPEEEKKEDKKSKKDKEKEVVEIPMIVKRHGKGIFIDREQRYEGSWKADAMDGFGTFHYASGATYEGEWVNNRYEGKGKYIWPDGSFYEGQFHEDKMHGLGYFTDINGKKWKGNYYNGIASNLLNVVDPS
eukprot:TRINITY_DN1631_c0_g1_i4.p1 TRINITY_DN1631_c0_g1~~TRINITY_DN1631_c0_g1_i4.p1  ORF type:complete len:197 (-),score=58.11 TRINITY_DN1631_c0_g1_i4:435-1025(-)